MRGAQLELKKASSSEEKAAAKATWTAAKQAAWESYEKSIQKIKVAAAEQRPSLAQGVFRGVVGCAWAFWRRRNGLMRLG